MAYDENLARRIRAILGPNDVAEKKMFGGLAFLVNGNMAIAASGQGGILVRVDKTKAEELLTSTPATSMEMHGRSTPGWLRVTTADVADDDQLDYWVRLGVEYASSLPAKSDRAKHPAAAA